MKNLDDLFVAELVQAAPHNLLLTLVRNTLHLNLYCAASEELHRRDSFRLRERA